MTMTKVEINEKNMATINSILEKGFRYHNEDDQPKNINQVIARLIELVHYEDYLKEETSDIYWEWFNKEMKEDMKNKEEVNDMDKKVEDRVYFVHEGTIGIPLRNVHVRGKVYFVRVGAIAMSSDFFIRGISPINTEEEARQVTEIDYYLPDCEYVKEFLKGHPDYVYVGSADNMHSYGWGMSFEGYKKIDAPLGKDIKNKEEVE